MSVYQDLWRSFAPPWFRTARNVGIFYESMGALLDSEAQRSVDARLAGIVYAGAGPASALLSDGRRIECQPDALPLHSADRGIKLYPTEGILSQRIRLSQWWQLHAARGTHWGEIAHARPYFADRVAAGFGYPAITIGFQTNEGTPRAAWAQVDPSGNRTLLYTSPSNLNYDGFSTLRSRWWVFVDMAGTGYSPPETYDSGGIYDTSGWQYDAGAPVPFTAAAGADVASMFYDWKAAHSWCGGVVAVWPQSGGAPFPTAGGTPAQDATGWWSLPNGANTWAGYVDPGTGKGTRPPNFLWLYDNPAPLI